MNTLIIYIVLLSFASNVFCLKLLVVFPLPAKSHYTLGNELAKGLAKAGNEVTIISCYSEPKPPENYKEIVLSHFLELKENDDGKKNYNMFEMENIPPLFQVIFLNNVGGMFSTLFLEHPTIQALLKSDGHFDAVIVEQFWNDAMKILAYHFKAHLIMFSTIGANRWVNNLVANPEPPSYVPDAMLSFTGDMTFYERIYNLVFGLLADLHLYLYFYPNQNAIMKKYYPNAPHINEIQYNVSLILINSHESVNQPVPHVPNMIDIGGFHVNPPKELPPDLKQFMENATNGVIYFSLGSNLVPSFMPKEKKDALLRVLGARKEKVLWKWDEDTLDNKPDNMMISKWFPQQSILAHPNCKLFITHGGLLSTTETVYIGVPVLALPIFGDQKLNAARAVSLGYGKSLTFSQINENNLAETLNELLENPSYLESVKLRSRLLRDRPVKPMGLAIYWIEYVVRHKGAPHLRVAGLNLPLYKYYMLDIIGALTGGLVLVTYLLSKLCRCRKSTKSLPEDSRPKTKSKKKRE